MSSKKNTVIVIAGPTASGKTALAIKLAKHFNTSVISADSRQCFRELSIGVAKPTAQELNSVKHYFIDSHSIHENVTAQAFEEYALKAVNEIFQQNTVAIMAGGTGLYINAFCDGLDAIPEIDAGIRIQVVDNYERYGLRWLQNEVQQQDPSFWKMAEQQNPQRLMRALEVKIATGQSVLHFRKGEKKPRPFNILKIGIDISKEQLYANINLRTDQMIAHGLIEEAASLTAFKNINALQTVGYKELFEYFEGRLSLEAATEKIKTNTRHYAKRQTTWFKKDKQIKWLSAMQAVISIDAFLSGTGEYLS